MGFGSQPTPLFSIMSEGTVAVAHTTGNMDCHVILRGSTHWPNYSTADIDHSKDQLHDAQLPARLIVDCSHDNSDKNFHNQPLVAQSLAKQIAHGESTFFGVMLEWHLHQGNQTVSAEGRDSLKYGVSIIDGCINWDTTEEVLTTLADAVLAHRLIFTNSNG